ncbi:GNAT family N-acetyltransferase [Streptomyces roseifaciens]|uniref:GNAT family N-acetyltransferase n=1 Tax=Streptomyces roseifaciens TaxID=1488406 RepID=UPI000717E6E2|nr:GNAT family protein [Streptomyces roseifaciens]
MFALPLGDNAQLRPLEPRHAQEFLAHIDRARPHVDPWIPWATLSTDLASATAVLQRYADGQAGDTARIYGIWLDGTLVGGVMFTKFDAASGVCEIGCWLEADGAGRGLVTRACRTLIDWAFEERGMSRVEWWVAAGNTRSIEAARRLGMTRDGVLRQRYPYRGTRHDSEVWSVLADEWGAPASGVKAELDRLMRAFLGAFTNTGGTSPNVGVVRELFIPQGTIIKNIGGEPVVHDLDAFVEPRQKMLTDGTLTEFSEWEVAERTEIFGSIAHRFSEYRKSGFLDGEWFEGAGRKTTQFVRTPAGWRMSSMAWDDV